MDLAILQSSAQQHENQELIFSSPMAGMRLLICGRDDDDIEILR